MGADIKSAITSHTDLGVRCENKANIASINVNSNASHEESESNASPNKICDPNEACVHKKRNNRKRSWYETSEAVAFHDDREPCLSGGEGCRCMHLPLCSCKKNIQSSDSNPIHQHLHNCKKMSNDIMHIHTRDGGKIRNLRHRSSSILSRKLKYTYLRYGYTAYLVFLLFLDARILHAVHSNPQSNLPNHRQHHYGNVNADVPSSSNANTVSTNKKSSANAVNPPNEVPNKERDRTSGTSKQKSSLVEVYEHEYYCKDTNMWLGGSNTNITAATDISGTAGTSTTPKSTRWTNSAKTSGKNIKILPPPSELSAPKGYEYEGDWKIDVSGEGRKDDLGWEYYISVNQGQRVGRRRRRWLRTVVLEVVAVQEEKEKSESMKVKEKEIEPIKATSRPSTSKPIIMQTPTQKLLKQMIDSFNFKGFGMTASKSLITKTVGLSWRMPLSANFNFFESRPFLPVFSSTLAVYFPLQISFLINASLPLELLQTAIWAGVDWGMWVCTMLYCIVLQTILWDLVGKMILWNSVKAFQKILALGPIENDDTEEESDSEEDVQSGMSLQERFRKESFEKRMKTWWRGEASSVTVFGRRYPPIPKGRRVVYNSGITDRLGVSVGMHLSKTKGFETRWAWWHVYQPTIDFLSTKFFPKSRQTKMDLYQWMRDKFASLGISWGGIVAPETAVRHYSCSSLFTLSGLYPSDAWRKFCEMQSERKNKVQIGKTLDSSLKRKNSVVENKLSESEEYEEILEVKVGAS